MIGKHPLMADCSLMARDRGFARIISQKPRMIAPEHDHAWRNVQSA
jgi:hypothetical protein